MQQQKENNINFYLFVKIYLSTLIIILNSWPALAIRITEMGHTQTAIFTLN